MVQVMVPRKILSPSSVVSHGPLRRVFASAPKKNPLIRTSRVTIGMIDYLNLMTAPFILYGVDKFRCKGKVERR